jgi:hypothetical protein
MVAWLLSRLSCTRFTDRMNPPFSDSEDLPEQHPADDAVDRRQCHRRRGARRWRQMKIAFFVLAAANVGAFFWVWQIAQDNGDQTAALKSEVAVRTALFVRVSQQREYDACQRGNDQREVTADAIDDAIHAALGPPPVDLDARRKRMRDEILERVSRSTNKIRRGERPCGVDPSTLPPIVRTPLDDG